MFFQWVVVFSLPEPPAFISGSLGTAPGDRYLAMGGGADHKRPLGRLLRFLDPLHVALL